MRKEKGITLIALVITIVVMIILVGVSVTALISSGLFGSAKNAKKEYEEEVLKDEVTGAVSVRSIWDVDDSQTLKQILESGISGNKTVEEVPGITDTCYVTRQGITLTVYSDGTIEEGRIEVWDGTSVACPEFQKRGSVWDWYIYTPSQLKFLADFVNNGNQLTGTVNLETLVTNAGYNKTEISGTTAPTVYLMCNLDMGARSVGGATVEAQWETTANESKNWIPIGIDNDTKKFIGVFEGQGYSIRGLYINRTEPCNGIFGNTSTIKNLAIKNSYIKAGSATGGIAGVLTSGKIENCHNIDTTVILREGNNYMAGGIVGKAEREVLDCSNTGTVIGYGVRTDANNTQAIGGIAGYSSSIVSSCINYGSINGSKEGKRIGGIVGNLQPDSTISLCTNNGAVNGGKKFIGGIAGISFGTIKKCNNTGEIKQEEDIDEGYRVGGIVGDSNTGSKVELCINSGLVYGHEDVGGIVGVLFGTTDKCYNTGTIISIGKKQVGGIVGVTGTNCTVYISNCYNTGTIVVTHDSEVSLVGGIVGDISATGASGNVSNNYSCGSIEITGTSVSKIGGVIGSNSSSQVEIRNNYYEKNKSNVTLNSIGEGKTAEEMKTQSFVNLLNTDQTPAVWEINGENNGYPVLIGR